MKLITVNGRKLIKPKEPLATLNVGRPADYILCERLPALETTDPKDIDVVVINGQIQIDRRK